MLNEAGLFDYAVKALGRRMRSEAELRRMMKARVAHDASGEAAIVAVLARVKEYGYLNDASFAETMRGCGRRMRSLAKGACARICSRKAFTAI